MAGPLDYVNPPSPMGMDPFFLAGLGMLGQAGQPGAAGIGQGAMQGLLAYSQMQQAELQNQAARRDLELQTQEREERARALAQLSPEARPYAALGIKAPVDKMSGPYRIYQEMGGQAGTGKTFNEWYGADYQGPGTEVNIGTVPSGWQQGVDPVTGETVQRPVTGGPATRPTEGERKVISNVGSMLDTEDVQLDLLEEGYDPTGLTSYRGAISPLRGKQGDRWRSATTQGVNIYGAMVSGADVTEQQRREFNQSLYPQQGEHPSVIYYKALMRLNDAENRLPRDKVGPDHPHRKRLRKQRERLEAWYAKQVGRAVESSEEKPEEVDI